MRVLFLQRQPCIRALKEAAGLAGALPGVHLGFACQGATLDEWYGAGDELFERWWRLGADPTAELGRVVAEFAPDVVHCHNLPDRLTVVAVELCAGAVPVVHDCHDLQSVRRTPYEDGFPEPADPLALEKQAVEGCDALVVVSEEMLEEIAARHRPPERVAVFPNYALRRDLPTVLPAPASHGGPPRIVYQGTLSTNGGHYDLRETFAAVVAGGATLDVFPGRPAPEYEALAAAHPGMRCHTTLPPRRLLERLPTYDFGWAGFNASLNGAHLDTALPNKLFEYLGCGLPVLTLGHRAMARFLAEEGLGASLTSLDALADQLAALDLAGLRRRVAAARSRLTVEANVGRLVDLYAALAPQDGGAPGGNRSGGAGVPWSPTDVPASTDVPAGEGGRAT